MAENTKLLVIDASFMLSFLLPDEKLEIVDQVFELYAQARIKFISSKIFHLEVANGLKSAVTSKRISQRTASNLIKDLETAKVQILEVDHLAIFKLAMQIGISVYDASYLYLAKKYKLELLTLDEKLK